jgi:endoglucanase
MLGAFLIGCSTACRPGVAVERGRNTLALSIRADGPRLSDARGNTIQLRGVNVSGFEGWGSFGGPAPDMPSTSALLDWKVNAVRLPLNEAGWLGLTTVGMGGNTVTPFAATYQATVKAAVAKFTAAGIYTILDLHWSAPSNFAANVQNPMMDADNSLKFWISVSSAFKNNPAVLFELFNEPYIIPVTSVGDGAFEAATGHIPDTAANAIIRGGGTASYYFGLSTGTFGGKRQRAAYTWQSIGYQQAIDAIRSTEAGNVIICGGNRYSSDLSWWSQNPPSDPLNQLAGAIHAYPSDWSTFPYNITARTASTNAMLAPVAAHHPIIMTELGDETGSNPAPFATAVLAWADLHGYSVMAWTWNAWGGPNTLIKSDRTPTEGLGRTFHDWTLNHK